MHVCYDVNLQKKTSPEDTNNTKNSQSEVHYVILSHTSSDPSPLQQRCLRDRRRLQPREAWPCCREDGGDIAE